VSHRNERWHFRNHERVQSKLSFCFTRIKAKHAIVTFKIEKAVDKFGAVPWYVNSG